MRWGGGGTTWLRSLPPLSLQKPRRRLPPSLWKSAGQVWKSPSPLPTLKKGTNEDPHTGQFCHQVFTGQPPLVFRNLEPVRYTDRHECGDSGVAIDHFFQAKRGPSCRYASSQGAPVVSFSFKARSFDGVGAERSCSHCTVTEPPPCDVPDPRSLPTPQYPID